MGASDPVSQSIKSALDAENRIKIIDSISKSPEDRASEVLKVIQDSKKEFTNWDIICFAVNYLAMQAAAYDWITKPIAEITMLVYKAHYYFGHEIGLYKLPYRLRNDSEKMEEERI